MGLIKPPNIMTFFIATALVVAAIASKMGAPIPVITGEEFWPLLVANILFILGCITRGF
ncbi:MAG: hypothetical protein KKB37_15190 [Alphaproteobacteria bacterium]|nr:hypothetical protein [Alphaproteobacteria bacterium]